MKKKTDLQLAAVFRGLVEKAEKAPGKAISYTEGELTYVLKYTKGKEESEEWKAGIMKKGKRASESEWNRFLFLLPLHGYSEDDWTPVEENLDGEIVLISLVLCVTFVYRPNDLI